MSRCTFYADGVHRSFAQCACSKPPEQPPEVPVCGVAQCVLLRLHDGEHRIAGEVPSPGDSAELEDDGMCVRCGRGPMHVEYGDEPTDECHSCAHELVVELRAKLAEAEARVLQLEALMRAEGLNV